MKLLAWIIGGLGVGALGNGAILFFIVVRLILNARQSGLIDGAIAQQQATNYGLLGVGAVIIGVLGIGAWYLILRHIKAL